MEEEHIFRSQHSSVAIPDNLTLPEFVLQGAEEYADKVAMVEAVSGKSYTYGQVVRDTHRFAKALRSIGLRKGRVVVVILPNVAEYPIVALGIMQAGGVFSGANPAAHSSEIQKQVQESEAIIVVTNGPHYEKAYGLTEHSCITLTHADPSLGRGVAKRNSVGFVLPNLEVKFIDPDTGKSLPRNTHGEVCVRSQCVMQGYYKNVEETERTIDAQGWLHTGDIGYIDDDGDIFIVDRIKELIKYKGFQVAPAELEAVLLAHPSVDDVAVVPFPDEEAGEIPVACVVKKAGSKESEEEIMSYVASNVATYKRVRALHFVDTIPRSPSGKIMRRWLKDYVIKTQKNGQHKRL